MKNIENKTDENSDKCIRNNPNNENCKFCNGLGEYKKFNLIFYCDEYDSGKFDKDGKLK